MSKDLIKIIIIGVCFILGLMPFFIIYFPILKNFFQESDIIFYWVLFSILLSSINIYFIVQKFKKINSFYSQQKYLLENISPQKAIVEDFIIYREFTYDADGSSTRYDFIPVIKNLQNGKRYITFGNYNFSSYNYYYNSNIFNGLDFSYKSINNTDIKLGSNVNIYIQQEFPDPILKENNSIAIYNKIIPYFGNINNNQNNSNTPNANKIHTRIYNLNKEKNLFDEPIVYFKGMIDFEEKPSLNNYYLSIKRQKKKKMLTLLLIPIESLLLAIAIQMIF